MILWSVNPEGPWKAFESFARTAKVLSPAYQDAQTPREPWLPRRVIRQGSVIANEIREIVVKALAEPNRGAENERFERDLSLLKELLGSGDDLYLCGARTRGLLDPTPSLIRWSDQQSNLMSELRKLLHPKHMASHASDLPDSARVSQGLCYANARRDALNQVEQAVLWRLTHLFSVLSFCELIVALGFPNENSTGATVPSMPGAVVAAKSALELVAHFVSGGATGESDPFDDAAHFPYTTRIRALSEEDEDWKDASSWYNTLCDAVKRRKEFGDEELRQVCEGVINLVCRCQTFRQPIPEKIGPIVLLDFDLVKSFTPPTKPYSAISYRTVYDECPWPTAPAMIDSEMSWSGIDSTRLRELGYSEVLAHDSPAWVRVVDLLSEMTSRKPEGTTVRAWNAAMSLIRAFCICKNLGNALALGAIARELHLCTEELTVQVGLCGPYGYELLRKEEDKFGKESEEYRQQKAREDDKSLKFLEQELVGGVGALRGQLQDVLQSFAHPGWLIRTELLRVREDPGSGVQTLYITGNYSPPDIAQIVPIDGSSTKITRVPLNPHGKSHFEAVAARYPKDLRLALTGKADGEIATGSVFDVPFVAYELCRRAIHKIADDKTLLLAYLFHADAPEVLPDDLENWFEAFPVRQGASTGQCGHEEASKELSSYVDNTYFFSRSCREYLFPEIVELEGEILRTAPTTFNEEILRKTFESTWELSETISAQWIERRSTRVVPDSRRLRRYLVNQLDGVARNDLGWWMTGSLSGDWERTVESVDFRVSDVEVQLYQGNVGVVLFTVYGPESSFSDMEFLKNLAAATKDVLPPNTSLPVADLRFAGIDSPPTTWMTICNRITEPFRRGDSPNASSILNPANQEFGQYFRRLWYLPECDAKAAYNVVRTNYLQPYRQTKSGNEGIEKEPPESCKFEVDEGWEGLVHHHEFVISRKCDQAHDEETSWWYRVVLKNVVFMDYHWIWLLSIVQRVRLGRLLSTLDVSAPSDAESDLQAFYDFMQQENFATPSTQPVGNLLSRKLSELAGVDVLIEQINHEAEVIRESILQRSSRAQQAALVVIALFGTWLSLGELRTDKGELDLRWFTNGTVWLALPAIIAAYLLCRTYLLRRRRSRRY